MLSGERRSTSAAHHFSFCSKLPYLASSAAYVNPCRPAALALISEGRGATNDRRRSAGNQLGSSGRAGRYWPVKRVNRPEQHWICKLMATYKQSAVVRDRNALNDSSNWKTQLKLKLTKPRILTQA